MRWLIEAVKCDSLLDFLPVLSITFIVFDWIVSQFPSAGANSIADAKGEESPENLSTEYHFSGVGRKPGSVFK
jgi:hypothetical protein